MKRRSALKIMASALIVPTAGFLLPSCRETETLPVATVATVDAVTELLNCGDVRFESKDHMKIATCDFSVVAFKPAKIEGDYAVAVSNITDEDSLVNTGTIDHAHLITSGAKDVIIATCGGLDSNCDFKIENIHLLKGDTFWIDRFTISMQIIRLPYQ